MSTIKDLNVKLAKTQQNMVNTLVEENPILDSIPVKPATHGIYNVYSKVTDIEGMDEVDYDDELPVVGISFALDQTRLGKIGGKLHMPQDAAMNMGGYDAYAADRFPSIIKKSGNDFEYRVYYKGFLAAALQNGKAVGCGGTTPNKQYSLVAVTYNQDTTIGLYNPNAVNAGKLFDNKMLNGGNEYEIEYAGKKFIGKVGQPLIFRK